MLFRSVGGDAVSVASGSRVGVFEGGGSGVFVLVSTASACVGTSVATVSGVGVFAAGGCGVLVSASWGASTVSSAAGTIAVGSVELPLLQPANTNIEMTMNALNAIFCASQIFHLKPRLD